MPSHSPRVQAPEVASPAYPVFVLGPRAEAQALANLLESHPRVAAVVDHRHHGVRESLFLTHFARAWDWSRDRGRAAALEAFLSSEIGRVLDPDWHDRKRLRDCTDAITAYRTAFRAFAWRQGAAVWLDLLPGATEQAADIARALPEARFVVTGAHRAPQDLAAARDLRACRALARRHPDRVAVMPAGAPAAQAAALLDRLGLDGPVQLAPRCRFRTPEDPLPVGAAAPATVALAAAALDLVPRRVRNLAAAQAVMFPADLWRDPADVPEEALVAAPTARPAGARPRPQRGTSPA